METAGPREVTLETTYRCVVGLSSGMASWPIDRERESFDERPPAVSYSTLSLESRVAVVVGGTSGIGRAMALGLAEAGANVVATARGAANLDATAAEIEALGRRTLRVASDVTDRASLEALRDAVVDGLGRVDI